VPEGRHEDRNGFLGVGKHGLHRVGRALPHPGVAVLQRALEELERPPGPRPHTNQCEGHACDGALVRVRLERRQQRFDSTDRGECRRHVPVERRPTALGPLRQRLE
jgi:hypothetical protein